MSAGEVAVLTAALALRAAGRHAGHPLLKLGGVRTAGQRLVADVDRQTVPLLTDVTGSVKQVNAELVRVDANTANVHSTSGNVS